MAFLMSLGWIIDSFYHFLGMTLPVFQFEANVWLISYTEGKGGQLEIKYFKSIDIFLWLNLKMYPSGHEP